MAIYIQTGKGNTEDSKSKGKYPFFDRSNKIKRSNEYIFDGQYTIIPGEGIFNPKYYNGKFNLHQRAYALTSDSIENKYLFYFLEKYKNIFYQYSVGSTVASLRLSSFSWVKENNFPSLKIQKQIIDIIEPNEKLFLNHSNCIRIDSIKNTKKDMKNLIDIIEPIEWNIIMLDKILLKLKIILKQTYDINHLPLIPFVNLINKCTKKRMNENEYFQTNSIGELDLNFSKKIVLNKNTPSRANLVPIKKSILFSKLIGENKVLPYFQGIENSVFSTGFYNITTKYYDHVLSFLIHKNFKIQKSIFSNGTTMIGINDRGLSSIMIKKPFDNSNNITKIIENIIFLKNKLVKTKNKTIKLLIR